MFQDPIADSKVRHAVPHRPPFAFTDKVKLVDDGVLSGGVVDVDSHNSASRTTQVLPHCPGLGAHLCAPAAANFQNQ